MPTGGIQAIWESVTAWFKAGVAAVGIGGDLVKKEYLDTGNFDAMAVRMTAIMALIRNPFDRRFRMC
jgi:2-dehydro-3-deoxyphosphogluconate aldolase/(4S)-4-hydroxy-2-oxoglutarate aldolase